MNHACLPSIGKAVTSFESISLSSIPYPLCEGVVKSLTTQRNSNWSPGLCSRYRSAIANLVLRKSIPSAYERPQYMYNKTEHIGDETPNRKMIQKKISGAHNDK